MNAIVQRIEGSEATFAIAVFAALRWLANDDGSPEGPFSAPVALIAHRSGTSYNKASSVIKVLEKLGLVYVQKVWIPGTKARGPSTYTFPTLWGSFPTGTGAARAERIKEQKESKESEKKETSETTAPAHAVADGNRSPRELTPIPLPTKEEAKAYAAAAGIKEETAHAWWNSNESKRWMLLDAVTGRPNPIVNWKKSLDAFARKDQARMSSQIDTTTSDEFWEWIEGEGYPHEVADRWIKYNTERKWRVTNKQTGREEPIFDFRASFKAFLDLYERKKQGLA